MDPFSAGVDIIAGRFSVVFVKHPDDDLYSPLAASGISYCIDEELLYEPFYADFGPLNLGKTFRFCELTKQLLQEAEQTGKKLYLHTGPAPQQRANTAVLVGIFQVLHLGRGADAAYAPLAHAGPYMPFRDASCGIPTFNLQPIDCIRGIAKARDMGFLDASGGSWRFPAAEYEHYEQVENGDLNWIVPGKLLAFSGPAARPTDYVGFRAMTPEDYWSYFHAKDVRAVVRLNKKVYEAQRFVAGGFEHHELYFPDGSCPSQEILLRFLALAEATPGCLAIHCKAGLGRTGVLICAYIMKHYRFTAEEVIGYIRVCRPGSVIGPQQGFVKDIQPIMWAEGDAYRARHGPVPPPLSWGITPAAARIAAAAVAAKAGKEAAAAGTTLVVDATGRASSAPLGIFEDAGSLVAVAAGRVAALAQSFNQRHLSSVAAPLTPAAAPEKPVADLSLRQLRERLTGNNGSGSGSAAPQQRAAAAHINSRAAGAGRAAKSGVVAQQLFAADSRGTSNSSSSNSSSTGPLVSGLIGRPSSGQSLLQRHAQASAEVSAANSAAGDNLRIYYGAAARSSSTSSAQQQQRQQVRERASGGFSAYSGGSTSSTGSNSSSLASTREAAIGALLTNSIASLRATLHTDKVGAATRPKATPEGGISQSSDFAEGGWRTPLTAAGVSSGRPQSGVARVLAPNGQPRKVPVAALSSLVGAPGTPQQQQQAGRLSAYYAS